MSAERNIPEKHVEFCRWVGRMAKDAGLSNFRLQFRPNALDFFHDEINATWEAGRHGADADKLFIESTVRIHTTITAEEETK